MKILVLSDIHHKFEIAQKIIDSVEFDRCILLGDYFDDYGDTPENARKTAVWLKEKVIPNPKMIPLMGNHDVNYFFPMHPEFYCSGFSHDKCRAIRSVISPDDVKLFKFYHIQDGWMFSHAGLHVSLWKEMKQWYPDGEIREGETLLNYFSRVVQFFMDRTMVNIYANMPVPYLECGWDRGGNRPFGGLIWCDWNTFASIKGINQIVGHTPDKLPRVHIQNVNGGYTKKPILKFIDHRDSFEKKSVSINYNLDTHLNHYATITDGSVVVYDVCTGLPINNPKPNNTKT